ncbi:hypothetical protein HN011_000902 [Eciton burchellii]|nr:hypothetical protein HN011_000902 [Eciton burchellii]
MWAFKLSYVLLQLWLLSQNAYCDKESTHDDVRLPADEDLKNIHSFFYMSSDKHLPNSVIQTKTNDQSHISTQLCNCKEWNERNSQEAVFYKRLITMLLSNLAIQRVDDRLVGMINIEASSSQYVYLQNFVNGQGSIREVDRILGNIIKQSNLSTYQFMAEISYYFNIFLERLMHYVSVMKERWDVTMISLLIIAIFMILRRRRGKGLIIFITIDVIVVISFFMTWWRLVQEAEIKSMAAQAQFTQMPIACQPHKMGLWDKIMMTFSSTNDCEKYYESIMIDPKLQVTPAYVLMQLLSTTILQPVSYLGVVISEFIENATSKLSFLYKFPIVMGLFLCIGICMIFSVFLFFGGSFNFGFGPFLRFGINGRSNSNEIRDKRQDRIERIYENTSPKKRLKYPEKVKQNMLRQNDDLAGGDTISGTSYSKEKCEKCKCKSTDEDEDEIIEYEEKEKKNGDC